MSSSWCLLQVVTKISIEKSNNRKVLGYVAARFLPFRVRGLFCSVPKAGMGSESPHLCPSLEPFSACQVFWAAWMLSSSTWKELLRDEGALCPPPLPS